jgi:Protein of unknown function (DUF2510)/Scramblase
MTTATANWFPDPAGQHEFRFYDGTQWTDQVSNAGAVGVAPLPSLPAASATTERATAERATAELNRIAAVQPLATETGTLFTEPVLIVAKTTNGKPKQFDVFNQAGTRLGGVVPIREGGLRRVLRRFTKLGPLLRYQIAVSDPAGGILLQLKRKPSLWTLKISVTDGLNRPLGRITQESAFTKAFILKIQNQQVARIHGTSWKGRERQIDINNYPVCNISTDTEGTFTTAFTQVGQYVVRFHQPLDPQVKTMCVAAALATETLLRPRYN